MNSLDKFYTNRDTAGYLIDLTVDKLGTINGYTILEPSAGNGSFSDLLFDRFDSVIAIDIMPDAVGITEMDFFDFVPDPDKRYVVLGNPPFGRVSSLAYKFVDHAMTFADYVCMLLPRTFKRYSIIKKVNRKFHLLYQEDVPVGVFTPKTMSAKTVYQVWERRQYDREIPALMDTTDDFEILHLDDRMSADFAVRAYGGNCGSISTDIGNLAPRSWHFIKAKRVEPNDLVNRIRALDFRFASDTVRQDSVGARELINEYNRVYTKMMTTV